MEWHQGQQHWAKEARERQRSGVPLDDLVLGSRLYDNSALSRRANAETSDEAILLVMGGKIQDGNRTLTGADALKCIENLSPIERAELIEDLLASGRLHVSQNS